MTAEGAAAVKDAYTALKTALQVCTATPPGSDVSDVPSRTELLAAAERVKADASKVGLMCSGAPAPSDQLRSLAGDLSASAVAFVSLCTAMNATAGPSLAKELSKLATGLATPCLALIKEMPSGNDLKQHVGMVWAGVAAVSKAPSDNKACLFKCLAAVIGVMKDALREMTELEAEQQEQYGDADAIPANGSAATQQQQQQQPQQAAAAEPGSADDGGGSEDGDGGGSDGGGGADLGLESERMSGQERSLLAAATRLLDGSTNAMTAFARVLLQGPPLLRGSEALEGWESTLFHARHLRHAAEDLGAAMYPPQDLEEVGGAALAVMDVTQLMCDEFPAPDAIGGSELVALCDELGAAHSVLAEQLADAQASANNSGGGVQPDA